MDKLRAKAQKRKELLAQSLGATSVEDLSNLLGSQAEKSDNFNCASKNLDEPAARDKTPSSTTSKKECSPARSRSPAPNLDTSSNTLPEAFVVAKVEESSSQDEKTDKDEMIDDVAKVVQEEFSSSAAFLKGTQSLNPHNDYSQNYVDTGQRPQNFIRDPGLNERFEEYPKLRELIRLKDELVDQTATPPMYLQCDLKTYDLSQLNTRFDVIIIEPTLAEYQHYSGMPPGKESWNWDDIEALDIAAIAENRSFIWLWAGSTPQGTSRARQCFRKWGFRRCEDICWVKTNSKQPGKRAYLEPDQAFNRTKEHCIMGIRGTVRRSVDGDFIHANVDIDLIITEEPTEDHDPRTKPEEIFLLAEHFCLGRRRLHIFGRDDTLRRGWVSIGPEVTSTYYESNVYKKFFEKNITTGCTQQIETLRPKSPDRNPKPIVPPPKMNTNKFGDNQREQPRKRHSATPKTGSNSRHQSKEKETKSHSSSTKSSRTIDKYASTSQHTSLLNKHRKRWQPKIAVQRTGGNMVKLERRRVIGPPSKDKPLPPNNRERYDMAGPSKWRGRVQTRPVDRRPPFRGQRGKTYRPQNQTQTKTRPDRRVLIRDRQKKDKDVKRDRKK